MRKPQSRTTRCILSRTLLLVATIAVFSLGYFVRSVVSTPAPAETSTGSSAGTSETQAEGSTTEEIWTCSMDPEVRLPRPGKCPKCGMPLILAMESEHDTGNSRTLSLSPSARKRAQIRVAPVERKFVSAQIRMVGKIDYDETLLKYITAWVPGRLDRLYVDYTGVPVSKGEHLVSVYSPELRIAQVELLESIKTAAELQSSTNPAVRQSANGLIEDARTKLRLWGMTEEQVAEIENRGQPSDHMTIYAPIGGIVIHKTATEGMYVNEGTPIYTIADLTRLWVKLDAYESDLAWLRYGQEVEFETEAYPGENFLGTVAFIDPTLDPTTRTSKVQVNVGNPDGRLKPQMFVRAMAHIKLAETNRVVNVDLAGKWICPMHPDVVKNQAGECDECGMPLVRTESLGFVSSDARPPLVIPASAPLITGKRAVVYIEVPGKPGTYEGREITLGARAGEFYIVRSGLEEGEQVVVNGNFKIDSAIQIMAKPSMMNPEDAAPPAEHLHGGETEPPPAQTSQREGTAESREKDESKPAAETAASLETFHLQLGKVFDAYFRIQTGLSRDSLSDAQSGAKEIVKNVAAVDMEALKGPAHADWMRDTEAIRKSGAGILAAGDIETARTSFALLSESMIAVANRFGAGTRPAHRFHCPMAFNNRGANWLQEGKKTENPYFGSAMFTCGTLKQTFEATAQAAESKRGKDDE